MSASDEIYIRPMDAESIPAVAELEQVCFSAPWSEESLMAELSNPHAVFIIATVSAEVAGYMGMHHILDEGYITNIAVSPSYRRTGIAARLIGHMIEYADTNSLEMVTLEVRPSNSAAIALYNKFGFQEEGRRKGFYSYPREDALILTRRLSHSGRQILP